MSEAAIKAALDGWFFSFDEQGKTRAIKVRQTHIPDHSPRFVMSEEAAAHGKRGGATAARPWTPEEDQILVNRRAVGARWDDLAYQLKRGIKGLRERYFELCAALNIVPVFQVQPSTKRGIDEATKAKIIELRHAGMHFAEISERLGLGPFVARDFYQRWKSRARDAA